MTAFLCKRGATFLTKIIIVSVFKLAMGTNEHVKIPSTDEDK